MPSAQSIRDSNNPNLPKKILRALKRRTFGEKPVYWYYDSKPRNAGKVHFSPQIPNDPIYAIFKITAKLGLEITPAAGEGVASVAWTDATLCEPVLGKRVINGNCTDISKHLVEREFENAFGYGLAIDPTSYSGRAIYKSNENGLHIGGVIDCPIPERDRSLSYQVLIDSEVDAEFFEEFRIPIIGAEIPLLYLKMNPIAHRFGNFMTSCALVQDTSLFISAEEVSLILKMMKAMHLDYGEIDALRDRHSGRLYVVDVNKTPAGPPTALGFLDKKRAVDIMAASFARLIG